MGKITTVFGVKGWVKVHSFTEPMENIVRYRPLLLKTKGGWKPIEFDDMRSHGQGFIAHIKGVDDRDEARAFCQCSLGIQKNQLPQLEDDEFYWSDLQGLEVYSCYEGLQPPLLLGKVSKILETGANDVLVVRSNTDTGAGEEPAEKRERLIPFLLDTVIREVNLAEGRMLVDWDPEF